MILLAFIDQTENNIISESDIPESVEGGQMNGMIRMTKFSKLYKLLKITRLIRLFKLMKNRKKVITKLG